MPTSPEAAHRRFVFSYCPPSRFFPQKLYLRPRRITLKTSDRPNLYRWLCFNFGWWSARG